MKVKEEIINQKTNLIIYLVQCVLILLYGLCTTYGSAAGTAVEPPKGSGPSVEAMYPMFQDVHVMMFVGFGFLYVYLGKYAFSSAALNLLIGVFVLQWSILVIGFWDLILASSWTKIPLDLSKFVRGDYAVAAVLISFGGVIGKLTIEQYLVMAFWETILYGLNLFVFAKLGAVDVGGSITIHVFGAYFGLAVSKLNTNKNSFNHRNNITTYPSNTFALIGTIFLWMFWPSFNAALAPLETQRQRTIINTLLSISVSCFASYGLSRAFHTKFGIAEIQNATLAGGVGIGAAADMMLEPFGAMLVGLIAGSLSVAGFAHIGPFLENKLNFHDTAGIHNLHGMPGVLGGIASIIACAVATPAIYQESLYYIFPMRAPKNETLVPPGEGFSAGEQAFHQLLALLITIGIGVIGGAGVGALLRSPLFVKIPKAMLFSDELYWDIPAAREYGFPVSLEEEKHRGGHSRSEREESKRSSRMGSSKKDRESLMEDISQKNFQQQTTEKSPLI